MKSSSLSKKNHQIVVMIINRCFFYSTHGSLFLRMRLPRRPTKKTVDHLAMTDLEWA